MIEYSLETKFIKQPAPLQPAAPEQPTELFLDQTILREYEEMMGEDGKAIIQELIYMYRRDAPELIETIRRSLLEGNLEQAARAAHKLKGNSATIGAVRLASLCEKIQHCAVDPNLENLTAQADEIAN